MVAPWERLLVYPGLDDGMPQTYSPVDFIRPDPRAHENFKSATPFDITLGAGDCLYLPAYWWSQRETSSEEQTILITFWYEVASEWARLVFLGLEQKYLI